MLRGLLRGAAAGAAGTTDLNTASYLDMAARGRGTSSTPADTVEKLSAAAGVAVPGEGETRDNRVQGLGALTGIATGVSVGAVLGPLLAGGLVLVAADAPVAGLGISDPRQWSAKDWAADVVPHLAYGIATHATLAATDPV